MSKNKTILYNAFCVVLSITLTILNAYWHRPAWVFTFAALAVANGICIIILKSKNEQ